MNYGNGGIILQSRSAGGGGMPAPPFDPTSAVNGLSVDPGTGQIVLGNDVGGSAAILLSDREIPNGTFSWSIMDAVSTFGMSMRSSNFANGVPIIANGYTKDSDTNCLFLQNSNGGASAAALLGVYNDVNTNFRVGVTGSGFNTPITLLQFPPDSCFFQTQSNANNAKLYVTAQGGIFFQSDLTANPVTPSMKLQAGDLTMISGDIVVKTSRINADPSRLQIAPIGGLLRQFTAGQAGIFQVLNNAGTDGIQLNTTAGQFNIQAIGGSGRINISPALQVTGDANFLIHTATTLTNNAGVGLGTLTNAPTAGDPAKWIAIDDNGTTRFIPTWI